MKFKGICIYTLSSIVSFLFLNSCTCERECKGGGKEEVFIPSDVKTSLLGFPPGTYWVFKCTSTSERDTVFLTQKTIYPTKMGACANRDAGQCCSYYYTEEAQQVLTVHSTSGLSNFSSYSIRENGFNLSASGTDINVTPKDSIYTAFPSSFNQNLSLALSGKVLNDIDAGYQFKNESTPANAYWSKQFGLVKYNYQTESGTILKVFERIDLP